MTSSEIIRRAIKVAIGLLILLPPFYLLISL